MASQDWFEKDFYATLGVPADADAATIKREYRKLARKYHPDQHPGDEAAETRFKEIGEAYAVLSDAKEREQYDAIRQMARGGARFAPGAGGGGGGFEDVFSHLFTGGGAAGGPGMRFSSGGGGQPDMEDILRMFGGGGGGSPFGGGAGPAGYGSYGAPQGPRRGADVEATVTVDLRQAAEGATITINPLGETVRTKIPAGVKDGQRIRLRGKGQAGDPQAPRGDLMLTVQVRPHPVFHRDGANLTVEVPVTFAEAALGATITVPTLNGDEVRVKVPAGTQSGQRMRVKGRGLPAKTGTGDLLVQVKVAVPRDLSETARAAVETLRSETEGVDVRADLRAAAAR